MLYVSFGSKVRPRTVGCIAMGSALLVQIARIFCRVWRDQSASCLSGFSMRLFCFVRAKTLCRYGCIDFLVVLVIVMSLT